MTVSGERIILIYQEQESKWDFPGGSVVRFHAPHTGGVSLSPGQETRSHVSQLKILHAARGSEILCSTTNIWCSQINKYLKK